MEQEISQYILVTFVPYVTYITVVLMLSNILYSNLKVITSLSNFYF